MKKLLVVLAAASCCTTVWTEEADPLIEEKPLSQLLKQLRSENRGLQLRAAQALAKAPEELRPKIIPQLIPLLRSDRENDRFVAAQTLGDWGPLAKAAVPDLQAMLEGTQFERNRAAAAKALGQILKDAQASEEVEQVAQTLTRKFNEAFDKYSDVRREAVYALGMIGPAAKSCVPKLTRALTDTDPVHGLGGEPKMVRAAAAWTCGRMGPLAAEHVDRLISMLQREGDYMTEIVEALGLIGPVHANVVSNIVDKIESADINIVVHSGFRIKAFIALRRFGPKAASALDFTKRFLSRPPPAHATENKQALVEALKYLQVLGSEAKKALPEVEALTKYEGSDDSGKALREEALKTVSVLKG